MTATVCHITSDLGLRKFQPTWFLWTACTWKLRQRF